MEGYFDVIRASSVGINNCVAPMGTALTREQVNILKKATNTIILCFDGDEAGKNATIRAIPLLEEAKLDIKIVRLEEKDPDEFIVKRGKDAFISKINNPISVIDFKMSVIEGDKNLNDAKDVSKYLDQIIIELVKEPDEFVVEFNLKKLATRFDMEYETLKNRYNKYKDNNKVSLKKDNLVVKKDKKVADKYGQATNNLLYYMTRSGEVVDRAENNVTMILDDKKRMLFNEMIYYYHKYGELIIADFITYLVTSTTVYDTFNDIFNMNLKSNYTMEEIDDYISVVNEYVREDKIKKLEQKLKIETDPMKQASISMEITKLRGVNNR